MNAHIFDSHSAHCPICRRDRALQLSDRASGLYTCPYCQQRLVVSQSGHYVRDPFALRALQSSRLLRRQSRPLARILRDFGITKPPSFIIVAGSVILLSLALAATERLNLENNPVETWMEEITEIWDPMPK